MHTLTGHRQSEDKFPELVLLHWVLEMVLVTLLCSKHLYPLNRLVSFLFPFFLLFLFFEAVSY